MKQVGIGDLLYFQLQTAKLELLVGFRLWEVGLRGNLEGLHQKQFSHHLAGLEAGQGGEGFVAGIDGVYDGLEPAGENHLHHRYIVGVGAHGGADDG